MDDPIVVYAAVRIKMTATTDESDEAILERASSTSEWEDWDIVRAEVVERSRGVMYRGGAPAPFCIVGKHPVGEGKKFRLVPATVTKSSPDADDPWTYDPDSAAKIVVCEDHEVAGEIIAGEED